MPVLYKYTVGIPKYISHPDTCMCNGSMPVAKPKTQILNPIHAAHSLPFPAWGVVGVYVTISCKTTRPVAGVLEALLRDHGHYLQGRGWLVG